MRRVVVHNGDDAAGNNANWQCRISAAHYTIDRDGEIFQHIGEERVAYHAGAANNDSIGIELQIKRKYGKTCNKLKGAVLPSLAKRLGRTEDDVVAEMCGPTLAQYSSLSKLLEDIRSRHTIKDVMGHCEVKGTSHQDPRAFDWSRVGQGPRDSLGRCDYYHLAAIKTRVVNLSTRTSGPSTITLGRGSNRGIEVGDHGYIEDASEEIAGWFVVDGVTEKSAVARIDLTGEQIQAHKLATVIATPGRTPGALSPKGASGSPKPTSKTSSQPNSKGSSLGSCESGYGYHRAGKIVSWSTRPDGTIATLTLEGAGAAHRVCDDSRGMIFIGSRTDAFVKDASGDHIRFQMRSVGKTGSTATITHGRLTERMLSGNKRVVVRKKK